MVAGIYQCQCISKLNRTFLYEYSQSSVLTNFPFVANPDEIYK